jgi:glycosyltransferase involved in cell wall biosynthesis
MKVLFLVHLWPPHHNAGGETFCNNIAQYLITKGHDVIVLLTEAANYDITTMYSYEGVTVIPAMKDITPAIAGADFIFTHLGPMALAIHLAKIYKKPICFISHNTHFYDVVPSFPEFVSVIYNTNAMAKMLNYPNRSIVLHPPIDYRKWDFKGKPEQGVYITLVNLNANKGVKLFIEIAKAMPERMFLGVGGSYDAQHRVELPNLVYMDNTTDMESVYIKTRVLLCPSKYESYGMVATEGMCNGIPIIFNRTFGLDENIGKAGIGLKDLNPTYEDQELKGGESPDGLDPVANLAQWVKAIRRLDNPVIYKKYSNLARARSRELDPITELDALEVFIVQEYQNNQEYVL